jgi:hypothetical protein
MVKKYLSRQTRSAHTYQFYKERRDDPRWHDDFLKIRTKRRIRAFTQIAILSLLIGGYYTYRFAQTKSLPNKKQTSLVVQSSSHLSSSTASISSNNDETANFSSSSQSGTTDLSYTTYAYLDSEYKFASNTNSSIILDFAHGTFSITDAYGTPVTYQIDRLLKHMDESLIVNGHGFTHNAENSPVRLDFSLLIVPAGKTLTRNWQTNSTINQVHPERFTRIAIAISDNNGRTFNMKPAYQAFIDYENDWDKIKSQNGATNEIAAKVD